MGNSYILVRWKHGGPDDPVEVWSELDERRFEVRKVEVWADGRVGYASHTAAFGGSRLGVVATPPLERIAADPQVEPGAIEAEAFALRWRNRDLSGDVRDRAERIGRSRPSLTADVRLFETPPGETELRLLPGFGCPVAISLARPMACFETLPLLGYETLEPGETRRLGFVFLYPESAETVRAASRFFLWAGRAFGEGVVVG